MKQKISLLENLFQNKKFLVDEYIIFFFAELTFSSLLLSSNLFHVCFQASGSYLLENLSPIENYLLKFILIREMQKRFLLVKYV